jgi:hypothetical protein
MRITKTGGRKKGTPNRRTLEVADLLDNLGCDPIEGMARLALDPTNSPELRGRLFSELAQYVAPKRKSIDVSWQESGKVVFNLNTTYPNQTKNAIK